ncbi:MAG TPA: tripartite tricarboxylate transporter substrate binding protein, partial [Burkholderiales bacterium]|nr:tripartite tricarboxylate transporter substrate binding protein [Burkholderiales bacterium]
MNVHSFVAVLMVAGCVPLASEAAEKSYPERPVRVIVGLAPGGGTDTVTRVMTQKLAEVFSQTFVVDNRPGAGGNIAGELAAHAAPDGYTLITVTPTHVVNPSLFRNVRYDAIRDFAPIVLMVYTSYVLSVGNSVPVTSVKELIALAKTREPRLVYASTGIGSANHLSAELFKSMAGIDMVHVPYKGGAPALSALLSGEVHLMFTSIGGLMPHIKAGRVRALAVTGAKRSVSAPDIPTIAEAGVPGYEVTGWYGMAATAGTPKSVITLVNTT